MGRPMPGVTAYSATKGFARFLSNALGVEYAQKVDCLLYEAGEVATKMIKKRSADLRTCSTEMAAATCLRDLGLESTTNGCFRHESLIWLYRNIPLFLAQSFFYNMG